jgi:hypothetical protein
MSFYILNGGDKNQSKTGARQKAHGLVNLDKHYVNVHGWWQVGRAHVYFVALIGHVNVGDDAPRVRQKLKQ